MRKTRIDTTRNTTIMMDDDDEVAFDDPLWMKGWWEKERKRWMEDARPTGTHNHKKRGKTTTIPFITLLFFEWGSYTVTDFRVISSTRCCLLRLFNRNHLDLNALMEERRTREEKDKGGERMNSIFSFLPSSISLLPYISSYGWSNSPLHHMANQQCYSKYSNINYPLLHPIHTYIA